MHSQYVHATTDEIHPFEQIVITFHSRFHIELTKEVNPSLNKVFIPKKLIVKVTRLDRGDVML